MFTERRFIRRIRQIGPIRPIILLLLSAALCGAAFAAEPQELAALEARAAALRAEQDLLLFRKEMLAADSKYLLIDLAAGRGEIRYRDRLLKEFRVAVRRAPRGAAPSGAAALTERRGAGAARRELVFGDVLAIQDRRQRAPGDGRLRIGVDRRDLASLFAVLDAGSRAYLVR